MIYGFGNSYKVILTWRDVKIFFQDNDIFRFGINVESSRQSGFIMLRNSCIPHTNRCMLQNQKWMRWETNLEGCNLKPGNTELMVIEWINNMRSPGTILQYHFFKCCLKKLKLRQYLLPKLQERYAKLNTYRLLSS